MANDRQILITGATDGIGLQTALELAGQGASLHLAGRNPAKLARAADLVTRAGRGRPPVTYLADLSSQAAIRTLAAEVHERAPVLDVLLNNAGGIFQTREVSADGIEMTFALDHLGYFLLTHLLLDRLKDSGGRIVNVASDAHRGTALEVDDLQSEKAYSGWRAYKRAKLANIMFTYDLAARLEGTGVTVNCLHPGFVDSAFGSSAKGLFGFAFAAAKKLAAINVTRGAETPVYLCSSPQVAGVSGKYFDRRKAVASSRESYDTSQRAQLWAISERLTGLMP
jgi:NAD(P)-dependent dehydrogenase (short-subunit alcohol dehydrogenase family)